MRCLQQLSGGMKRSVICMATKSQCGLLPAFCLEGKTRCQGKVRDVVFSPSKFMNQNKGNKGKGVPDNGGTNGNNRTGVTKQQLLQAQKQTWLPSVETLLCTRPSAKCFPRITSLHPCSAESSRCPL